MKIYMFMDIEDDVNPSIQIQFFFFNDIFWVLKKMRDWRLEERERCKIVVLEKRKISIPRK